VTALLALTFIGAVQAKADVRPIEDSYTISQRYEGYKDKYAGLTLPKSEFQAGQQVLFDRRYKKDGNRELHIDVFLPAPKRAKHQGLLLVHGGGWTSGDKSHFYALANLLAQRGYAVFLPEYRLSPEAKYPTGLIDVNDAILWVKANAADFDIPKDKLAIGGASSGGQMASLVAYTADTPLFKANTSDDTRVNALIDLDGVLDFTTPLALKYENAPGSVGSKWLGGSMEQIPDTWREASAAKHVSAKSPPTLIISSGILRFTAGREDVVSALNGFGIRSQYYEFKNAPHDIWLFEPYLSQIVNKVDAFLQNKK
jgi:acetyl esterase